MAYFDIAVGVTQKEMNNLLGQYYSSPPAGNNPFKGSKDVNIKSFGDITINWDIKASPSVTYGAPDQAIWDAALNDKGQTNKSADTPLPTGNIFQILLPDLSATYTMKDQQPVGGDTKNLVGYISMIQSGDTVTITPLAVTLDESSFSPWDKLAFNAGFLPQIFNQIKAIGSVIHIPNLSWHGITLDDPVFALTENLFVAAAVENGSSQNVDISDATWPTDDLFALVSKNLLNNGIANFTNSCVGKTESDSGNYKDLADWNYNAKIATLNASVSALSPMTVDVSVSVDLKAGGSLTPVGMALAAVGCGVGAAAGLI